MAFPTFTPPREPHVGTTGSLDQTVLEAKFGDGYSQIVADGLNADFEEVTLSWTGLDQDDVDDIKTHYRAMGRASPFHYTLAWDSTPKLWRYSGALSVSPPTQSRYNVSVTLRQAFDLG